MKTYIDLKEFPNKKSANKLTAMLEKNGITFQLDSSPLKFSRASKEDAPVIVMIQKKDVDAVNELILQSKTIDENHYINRFSDNDLVDVVANPENWTDEEVNLAQDVIRQRDIRITADDINTVRKNYILKNKEEKKIVPVNKSYNWFMVIGIVSILNSILILTKTNLRLVFGLGFTQVFDGYFYNASSIYRVLGVFISVLFSSIFFIFWYYAKLKRDWAYIIGLIIYSSDLLIFIHYKQLVGMSFHLCMILFIILGYSRFIRTRKKMPCQFR